MGGYRSLFGFWFGGFAAVPAAVTPVEGPFDAVVYEGDNYEAVVYEGDTFVGVVVE